MNRRESGKARHRGSPAVRLATFVAALATALFVVPMAFGGGNAGYTTFDATQGGCLDSPNGVDCNNYASRDDVYMNGGPTGGKGIADGDYYFAVLTPGSQNGGFIDGATGNLSDTTAGATVGDLGLGDDVSNRTFSLTGGLISVYSGSHLPMGSSPVDGHDIIPLSPYDDTDNAGGVYILAICEVGATSPSQCKFDAFRINGGNVTAAGDLTASKTAVPSFTRDFTWGLTKTACAHGVTPCKQTVSQIGGSVQFDYTVVVTKSAASDSGWQVAGNITVTNPVTNSGDAYGVTVSDGTRGGSCTVHTDVNLGLDPTGDTLPAGDTALYPYECTFGSNPGSGTNTATASWNPNLSDGSVTPHSSTTATANYSFGSPTTTNGDCITVTDTFNGTTTTLGSPCVTTTYNYSHTISVPRFNCTSYTNTASFTGANVTVGLKGSDSQTVTICGPANEGGLTIGFWKSSNGNSLIQNYCAPASKTSLATYLSGLGAGSGPFSDAAGKSCTLLVTYANTILNGASASNMNVMLKAQMLGSALDVYFSDPNLGYSTVGIGSGKTQIKPPSNFLLVQNLGTFVMDLTRICPMVDNTTSGTASCKNGNPSTNAFVTGAVPWSSQSVQGILNFAATTPSPFNGSTTNSIWYGGNKTLEEVLKNIFDQINNNDAFPG